VSKTYVSARPGTRMSPAQRVKILLTERTVFGRPLVFVDRPGVPGAAVHVVGPDEDQPAYTNVGDYLLNRRVRTVCGLDILRSPMQGTYIGTFLDSRICLRCHRRFGDNAHLIFADNTDARQANAHLIFRIRRDKEAA
jgi:hypothetical protein